MLAGCGDDAPAVLEQFVAQLELAQGEGPIALKGSAFIGTAIVATPA